MNSVRTVRTIITAQPMRQNWLSLTSDELQLGEVDTQDQSQRLDGVEISVEGSLASIEQLHQSAALPHSDPGQDERARGPAASTEPGAGLGQQDRQEGGTAGQEGGVSRH